jgi:hypothetical protein
MLIQKKYEAEQVISIKIANGDELIAKVVDEDDTSYTLLQPLALVPTERGALLVPAVMSIDHDKPVKISKSHVMLHGLTSDKIADGYREQTTGIQTVRNSKILV